jgi:Lactate racemase N-terminal domain
VHKTPESVRRAVDRLADLDSLCARLAGSPLLHDHEVLQLAPSDPPPIDLAAALATVLAKPMGTPPLHDLARGRRTAVIITTDATRATPSAALIGPIMEELARGGISSDGVEVVIGVGAHRPATRDEIQRLLGGEWATRLRVTNHDARADDLVEIGHTSHGVPLLLNRRVAEADLRIAFGQVEPHEFAGFTGGRKAILPSVAGYESIVRNHALDMLRAALVVRPARKDEPGHGPHLAPIRQRIESIFWTCKDLLTLERHGARTMAGLRERILARFLCLAACISLNHRLGRPSRALVDYCA